MNPSRENIRNLLLGIHKVVVDASMTGSMEDSGPDRKRLCSTKPGTRGTEEH